MREKSPVQTQTSRTAPAVYRPNNSLPGAGTAQRQISPAAQRIRQAPPVYHPQTQPPAAYVQRKAAGPGVIQRVCALCGGNEQYAYDANGDLVNGHAYGCILYHRTFQTAHDRAETRRTGIFQRSHSFRQLYQGPGTFDASGLYTVPPPVVARVHRHDNNASGGPAVAHYR